MKALVIIPTYNESENIELVINQVLSQGPEVNILVVDDNSPDGTAAIVKRKIEEESRLSILERAGKLGLGTAYIEGFNYALKHDFDLVFEMDADLSHDPNEIPNFLDEIKSNDLVIGSRYITGVNVVNWPLQRLLLSYFASIYARFITKIPIRDITGGFKCFRRETLEAIDFSKISSGGYAFQIEINWLVWKEGFRIKEIPIIFVDRTVGQSKMSKAIVREAVLLVWKLGFKGLFRPTKVR